MSKNKNKKPNKQNTIRDIASVVIKESDVKDTSVNDLANYRMISLEDDVANTSQS